MRIVLCGLVALALYGQRVESGSSADQYFTGGAVWPSPVLRYGNFSYQFPVTDGSYKVRLTFVDPQAGMVVGGRKFDVMVNGAVALAGYDIAASGGAAVLDALAAGGTGVRIQFVTRVRNAVVSVVEVEKFRPYASVTVLDGPDSCQPAGSFFGVHYGGHICAVPPQFAAYDFNFGAEVQALTGYNETMVHGYSLPSPVSATNRYIGVTDTNGNHYAQDRSDGTRRKIPGRYATVIWDAANDDWLYYSSGTQWLRYSVSTGASVLVAELKWAGEIQTGGSTHVSSDNWAAFWSNEDHQVCAVNFATGKTYCADMSAAVTRSDALPWSFVDYSVVTDVDRGSGKRYVMLMSYPALGAWSVDMAAGALRFEFRGGEFLAAEGFLNPAGNRDGQCDAGENCLNAPHGDATSIDGIQYFVTSVETSSTPCQRDLVALPIAQGVAMVSRRITILPLSYCSSGYEWPNLHVGCSPRTGACAISTDTSEPSPMGNQLMVMRDLDHVVKLGFHRSQAMGSDTYWFQTRAGISPDGRYVVFDSNLGRPDQGNGFAHEQVFLMRTGR